MDALANRIERFSKDGIASFGGLTGSAGKLAGAFAAVGGSLAVFGKFFDAGRASA